MLAALGAALLFSASTPFAKALLGAVPPVLLAGLLYAGSGTSAEPSFSVIANALRLRWVRL